MGKALIVDFTHEQLAQLFGGKHLPKFTKRTITTLAALAQECEATRQRGFAVDDEECSLGMRCVGAPIQDHRGIVVAALSVVAPCQRLTPAMLPVVADAVRAAAGEISRRLGHLEAPANEGR